MFGALRRHPLGHRACRARSSTRRRRAASARRRGTTPLQFIENSPIFWIENIHTPYLTIHNDEDDAVPWQQGIEFFTAMRRLGKEAYMFTFNGEKHGLRNRDNMKHWTVHMDEFFDYYLLKASRAGVDGQRRAVSREGQARRVSVLQKEHRQGLGLGD